MNFDLSLPRQTRWRRMAPVALVALAAGCTEPLDFDLRGQIGAFNTTEAAQGSKTADRPKPDANGLITYPTYQVAVARRGDTVTSVAARLGLSAQELARYNGIDPEVPLRSGEVLALPRKVTPPTNNTSAASAGGVDIASLAGSAIDSAPDTSVTASPLPPAPKPEVQAGPEPVRHKVARGETAYTISRLYGVPVKSLGEWNGLNSDFAIREGQYLLIPVPDTPAPKAAVAAPAVTAPGTGSATPTPPSATAPLPSESVKPAAAPVEAPKTELAPATKPANSGAAMVYPVQGKIIRPYKKGRNDGIDISGSGGTAVKAAAAGTVAAITKDADDVPIIVLRHADNLLTVYANVTGISVSKGSKVSRGQAIAKLRAEDAYVHFEVRNGFESVDPLPYLQ